MAKVTITLTDTPDGHVVVRAEVEPPTATDTPAANYAAKLLMIAEALAEQEKAHGHDG